MAISVMTHIRFLLLFLPSACSIHFKIARFDPTAANIVYEGDAVPAVGVIELTSATDYTSRVGRATYAEKVPLWDSQTGVLADFKTHFSFKINPAAANYGHGIAFFLAPVGSKIPLNSAGGFLGLFNDTTSDLAANQIVLVEFDTFINQWDPPYHHVGINNNSISSVAKSVWNFSLHIGDTTNVWIDYNATTTNLCVLWNYQTTPASKKESTILALPINLMKILPEWITIGFSAGTGEFVEKNQIVSWEFSSTLNRTESVAPGSDTGSSTGYTINITVVISVAVTLITVIIATTVLGLWWKKRRRTVSPSVQGPGVVSLRSIYGNTSERETESRGYSLPDLAQATENFSNDRRLGEGGSGTVYRGQFTDMDTSVAVKKISTREGLGRREYMTEVNLISSLRHQNLVQLKGWCHDGDQTNFLLVYEYMPNGSLDSHLFGMRPALTWSVRYKICRGLATAILYLHDPYLHEGWRQCVVHRDIKSSNILLDSTFNVKLGDFGLARIIDHELGPNTSGYAGTHGYMDPEYVITRRASTESDVYSFGVVALEIATGKRSVERMGNDSEMGLVKWVWDLYGRGELLSDVDERLQQEYDEKQAVCVMIVGLWCAHPDPSKRPSIREAIQFLNFDVELPNPPKKMPVRVYHESTPPLSLSSLESESVTSLQEG